MPIVEGPSNDTGSEHAGNGGASTPSPSPVGVANKSTSSMSNALRSFLRVVLRLVASGALTAGVDQLAGGLSPAVAALVLSGWASALTYAQVHIEDKTGKVIGVTPSTSTAVLNAAADDVGGVA